MQKKTAIRIRGAEYIVLSSPKGTRALRLEADRLVAKAGGKQLKLKPEPMAEVIAAAKAYRPPRYENEARVEELAARYGAAERAWEAEDEAAYFEMQREPREIDPGTGEITVWIGREDLA